MLDPERLEAISQGVAVPGCAEEWSRCVIRSVNPLAIPARGRERMAISLFSAQACAKTGDHLGENRNGNGLSWRSRFIPMALTPKPATGWGKFDSKPVYHGDSAGKSGDHAKAGDSWTVWGKSNGNPFIMAILQEKAGITPKPAAFNRLGKTQCETRLSWRS